MATSRTMILKLNEVILVDVLLFYETLIRLKKLATLLPNNWLAETPEALAPRRLGRQSAERERISEINWHFLWFFFLQQFRNIKRKTLIYQGFLRCHS
ncbi:hypothetical protein [Bacillus sp. ISL-57]|uniref:hypothetical protein n=1 Tax=Bacillus sp. ISL-57 TaxID=2819135 RepID=UPI001BE95BEE|nr:hypothetical protein [Bacillus sp. ISL-57]MBT2718543.1 hypothetical protein [Bacillus sp. ISL-57]